MDIEHASLLQVRTGLHGESVLIENDVLDVVRQIKEISPTLCVRYNERGEYFTVYEKCKDGVERLVTNVKHLDQRLVEHLRKIGSESWNRELGKQMNAMDDAAKRAERHTLAERMGELGERLHHAIRKDLQDQSRLYVPGYIEGR